MKYLFLNELLKLKRQKIWSLIIFIPLLSIFLGLFNFRMNYQVLMDNSLKNEWEMAWTQVTLFYSMFLLPIFSAVFASFLCRFEHLENGWKILFSLPLKRTSIILSKLLVVILLLFLTQFTLIIQYLSLGSIFLDDAIPYHFLIKAVLLGWVATAPLASIQIFLAQMFKGFSIPLAINVSLTFGVILSMAAGISMYYPWALPSYAMAAPNEGGISSMSLFWCVIIVTSVIAIFFGSRLLEKQEL